MIEEFGTTIGKDQPRWLKKALKTIKSKPGIKATLYWDNMNDLPEILDDHRLSEESMMTLKELLKGSYFIAAKK